MLAARWSELTTELTKQLTAVAPAEPGRAYPRPALRTPYVAPRSDTERRVAAVWCRYLGLERVGIDDQFFELGGNSLVGLTIVAELERELGMALVPTDFLEAPTPRALAELVMRRGTGEQPRDDNDGPGLPQAGGRGEQRRQRAAAAAARRTGRGRGAA